MTCQKGLQMSISSKLTPAQCIIKWEHLCLILYMVLPNIQMNPFKLNQISFIYTARNHNDIASMGFEMWTVNDILILRPTSRVRKN